MKYVVDASNDQSLHVTIRNIATYLIPLTAGGAGGVVVFFFCSGYIITHVLQKENAIEFIIKRIFRIYPLYISAILLEMLFAYISKGLPPPSMATFISRISLLGDFFDTPCALGGVEWTLRIEILFYVFMALIKSIGLFRHQEALPLVYTAVIALFMAMPAFPNFAIWSDGYFNIYSIFLFSGSCLYLAEKRKASALAATVFIAASLLASCVLVMKFQPGWKESNYAIAAASVFLLGWLLRFRLSESRAVGVLSSLTYSAYLFHGWLWYYLKAATINLGISGIGADLLILIILLLICLALTNTIEKCGITLGRLMLRMEFRRKVVTHAV